MKKVLATGLLLLAGCSGQGEIIPTPSPAPETTTTEVGASTALSAGNPTTTVVEPEPTTVPEPAPAAQAPARYLQPVATTLAGHGLAYGEWAIPAYIVSCETGGTFDWYAYNPSGASGPYQLMPVHFGGELAMNQSRAAQHAKAAELWDGGRGKSHWAACL